MAVNPAFVPHGLVRLNDAFWAPRQRVNRRETVDAAWEALERHGHLDALRLPRQPGESERLREAGRAAVVRWLEAAIRVLATNPSETLRRRIDLVSTLLEARQGPDGGFYFGPTPDPAENPEPRRDDLREADGAGALMEACIAHYEVTGSTRLLDLARRFADRLERLYGAEGDRPDHYPMRADAALSLMQLSEVAGEPRYRRLAYHLLAERERMPAYFVPAGAGPVAPGASGDARPPREPASDALLFYTGLAEHARDTEDPASQRRCHRLWADAMKRIYVTGGAGLHSLDGRSGGDYILPNDDARAETCSGLGLGRFAVKMFRLEPSAEYADVLEHALYNVVAAGVSLDGHRFSRINPMSIATAADGAEAARRPWFDDPCCATSVMRFLTRTGQYIYAATEDTLWTVLYAAGSVRVVLAGTPVEITQTTDYPWDGAISLTVRPAAPRKFTLALRIPGWCRPGGAKLAINGKASAFKTRKGYVYLTRDWRVGDRVDWTLDMPVARVYANPLVRANCGRVALRRGPLLYCFEEKHNGADLETLSLPRKAPIRADYSRKRFGGAVTLTTKGRRLVAATPDAPLYAPEPPKLRVAPLTAVPYAVWNNSGPGEMLVWIRESE